MKTSLILKRLRQHINNSFSAFPLILLDILYTCNLLYILYLEPNFHLSGTPDTLTQELSVYWIAFHAE